jgi:ubiquinone/menaquinone biosynthesis C-methylase UbiE
MATSKELAQYWDSKWEDSPDMADNSWIQIAYSIFDIESEKFQKMLDVGCGSAENYERYFTEKDGTHRQIVGIDISNTAIRFARENNAGIDSFMFEVGDGTALRFGDNSFDIVTAFDFLTSTGSAYMTALNEMWRVTNDYMIFNVTHKDLGAPDTLDDVLHLVSLNEREVEGIFMQLSPLPRYSEMRTFTFDEIYNRGHGEWEHHKTVNGERNIAILALARK